MTDRRDFLKLAAGAAGLVGLHTLGAARAVGANPNLKKVAEAPEAPMGIEKAARPLKILFLGGTGFIGPHQINYALARGHEVTMFNRGNKAGLYGDRVEEIVGNRDTKIDDGLKGMEGDRKWDVVIDNSGYVTRHVRDSVALLKDRVGRYLYISTVAAYDFEAASEFPEDGPLASMADPSVEEVTWETYGPLKAECDKLVRNEMGDRATVVRPTYIIGPGDHTDRFTYWAVRIPEGGDVVGPANAEVNVQFVDVRDLCPWIITLAENDTPGAFNAAASPWTRAGLLWGVRAITSEAVTFHWPTPAQAEELEIPAPMLDWGSDSNTFVNTASLKAGLVYRNLADSTVDTRSWWFEQPEERRKKARGWPSAEKESEILAALSKG